MTRLISLQVFFSNAKFLSSLAKLQLLDTALEYLVGADAGDLKQRLGSIYIGGIPTPNVHSINTLIEPKYTHGASAHRAKKYALPQVLLLGSVCCSFTPMLTAMGEWHA